MFILGNALDIKEKEFADCIVTDPPYKLTSGGKSNSLGGCFSHCRYDNNGNIVSCDISWHDIMAVCYKTLKPNSHAYIMCNDRNLFKATRAAFKAGFKFHNLLIWDKGTVTPNRWYMHQSEYALFLFKGKAKPIKNMGDKNIFTVKNNDKANGHPTQKPVVLLERWIENSSREGDLILDPFAGVASTGVAAINKGRKFYGVELEEKWHTIGKERLTKAKEEYWRELL